MSNWIERDAFNLELEWDELKNSQVGEYFSRGFYWLDKDDIRYLKYNTKRAVQDLKFYHKNRDVINKIKEKYEGNN